MNNIPIEEMPEEIDRLLEINEELKKEIERLNNKLKEDLEEYKQIGIRQFSRPYAKRYLKELRKEQPNLLYPDSEKIYENYYELRIRIERANNYIDQVLLYRIPNKTKEVYDDIERLQSILNGSDKE